MVNFGNVRNDRIYRLEKKLNRISQRLKQKYSAADLSQFLKTEKEIEMQKSYKQLEQESAS